MNDSFLSKISLFFSIVGLLVVYIFVSSKTVYTSIPNNLNQSHISFNGKILDYNYSKSSLYTNIYFKNKPKPVKAVIKSSLLKFQLEQDINIFVFGKLKETKNHYLIYVEELSKA